MKESAEAKVRSLTPMYNIKKSKLYNIVSQLEKADEILSNVSNEILLDESVQELLEGGLLFIQGELIEAQEDLLLVLTRLYEHVSTLKHNRFRELLEDKNNLLGNKNKYFGG